MDETRLLEIYSTNLNQIMKDEKMTQEKLSDEIGINQSMISRYITGQSLPSFLTAVKIAEVLGYQIDDFLLE